MASVFFVSSVAQAGQWKPNTELFFAGGDSRSYYGIANLYPWVQDGKSIIYSDIRYMDADVSAEEINLGGGYRSFNSSETALMGFYGALDYRIAPSKRRYSQITLGGEWLTSTWDYRLNAYLPITDKEITQKANVDFTKETKKSFQGNNLIAIETKTFNGTVYEEAMSGFDIEVGRKLSRYTPYEVRGYIGGYQFSGDIVGDTVGARFRLEARPVKAFVLNLSVENDPIFKSRGLMEMRWLFGQKFKTKRRRSLSERMTQFVVRDIDIRETSLVEASKRTLNDGRVEVTQPSLEQKYQRITHIDSSYTGANGTSSGTFERPYASFQACVADGVCTNSDPVTSKSNIIFVHADNKETVYNTNGFELYDGQELMGDGSVQDVGTNELRGIANGFLPILGSSVGTSTITLNANNHIAGFQFGSQDSTLVWDASNTAINVKGGGNRIERVFITGANTGVANRFNKGIHFNSRNNASNQLKDVTVTNVNGAGVHLDSVNDSAGSNLEQALTFASVYLKNNDIGLHVSGSGSESSSIVKQTITWDESFAAASSFTSGANVTDNERHGILVNSSGNARMNQDVSLKTVGIRTNGMAGIKFDVRNTQSGQTSELKLTNVLIAFNEGGGLHYVNRGGSSKVTLGWTSMFGNVDNPKTTNSATIGPATGYGIYMQGLDEGSVINQTLELLDIEDPNRSDRQFVNLRKPSIILHGKNKAQIFVDADSLLSAGEQKIIVHNKYATGIGGGSLDLFEYDANGEPLPSSASNCVYQIAKSANSVNANTSGVQNSGSGNYITITDAPPSVCP